MCLAESQKRVAGVEQGGCVGGELVAAELQIAPIVVGEDRQISPRSLKPRDCRPLASDSGSRPSASAIRIASSRLRCVNAASRRRRATAPAEFTQRAEVICDLDEVAAIRPVGRVIGEVVLVLDRSVCVNPKAAHQLSPEIVLEERARADHESLELSALSTAETGRCDADRHCNLTCLPSASSASAA